MVTREKPASIPRPILIGAALLIGVTIAVAAVSRQQPRDDMRAAPFTTIESRDLAFEDRADGSVRVIDAASGSLVATLATGEGGFTRSVLRGLVRERRLSHVGGKAPFRLERMANGGLMLGDPQTGREIHLAAFGPSNVAAFERLMSAGNEMR